MSLKNTNNKVNLQQKVSEIYSAFVGNKNKDLHIRELYIKSIKKEAAIIYLNAMVDSVTLQREAIMPLIKDDVDCENEDILSILIKRVLTVKEAEIISSLNDITTNLIIGNAILIVDGVSKVISLNTIGFEHRAVEKPTNENVLKGPKEAFTESAETNRSLIRRQVKNKKLVTEFIEVGNAKNNKAWILYLEDIANNSIVEKVKDRLKNINADSVENLGILEQYIEDSSHSLLPTILYTERPDRTSAFINEGHVAIIMDNSPSSLIVPITFWSFFHTGEDQYERWFYGNFIRLIRFIAFIISFIVPGTYIAVTNFHQEMLPTDLLLSIAGTRETMPFPAILEVLLMEISFELIREASTRIPTTIGPTIGIVGALILGQAAVEANIVSPILVIIVSITGLSSFAIPEVSFSYTIRIARFMLIFCGMILGFLGISLFISFVIVYLAATSSFDVPFMSPTAPYYKSSKDMLFRGTVWKQKFRPFNLRPKDKLKKK